eukprot:12555193-Alexandrium_andersonii.AAC.1
MCIRDSPKTRRDLGIAAPSLKSVQGLLSCPPGTMPAHVTALLEERAAFQTAVTRQARVAPEPEDGTLRQSPTPHPALI